jgi:RNA polymerase sigma-70 factor (ECF subfamily)
MITTVSPSSNNPELVEQAKAGDKHAYVEFVEHFERRVFRIAKQITMNDQDAEEVLIETFLKAYSALDDFQESETLWVWLVAVAAKESLRKVRDRSEASTTRDDAESELEVILQEVVRWPVNFQEEYSQEETICILESAMRSLDPLHRAIFVLRDIEELSIEDTARALGVSLPLAKRRLLRARLGLGATLTRHLRQKRG